jgi:hypothetical protein
VIASQCRPLPTPARRLTARIAQPTTLSNGSVVLHGERLQGRVGHPPRILPSPPPRAALALRQKCPERAFSHDASTSPSIVSTVITPSAHILGAHHIHHIHPTPYSVRLPALLLAHSHARSWQRPMRRQPYRDVSHCSLPIRLPARLDRPFTQMQHFPSPSGISYLSQPPAMVVAYPEAQRSSPPAFRITIRFATWRRS